MPNEALSHLLVSQRQLSNWKKKKSYLPVGTAALAKKKKKKDTNDPACDGGAVPTSFIPICPLVESNSAAFASVCRRTWDTGHFVCMLKEEMNWPLC